MSKRALIATRLFNTPLLAERSYADVFVSALADDLGIEAIATPEQMAAQLRPTTYPMVAGGENGDGIAVVPVTGALVHRAGPYATMSAMQGYAGTQNMLMAMAAEHKVKGIILDLDTPGGEVGGINELSDTIREIGATKPVWALANSLAASAGYWIGASASRFLAAPFARVGSIGVVTMHMDMSKAAEKRGIVVSFVHAGKHKVAGNQFAALDDETRERMQTLINETYDQFVAHVALGRNMTEQAVRDTEAMVYSAKEALELKLVDGISTLGQAIEQMRDHISGRGKTVNIQGTGTMDQAQIDALKAESTAAGIKQGTDATKARIEAILALPAAKDRSKLAMKMALTTDLSADVVAGILETASVETPPAATVTPPAANPPATPAANTDAAATADALNHLRANSPAVQGDAAVTAREERRKEIQANMAHRKTAA